MERFNNSKQFCRCCYLKFRYSHYYTLQQPLKIVSSLFFFQSSFLGPVLNLFAYSCGVSYRFSHSCMAPVWFNISFERLNKDLLLGRYIADGLSIAFLVEGPDFVLRGGNRIPLTQYSQPTHHALNLCLCTLNNIIRINLLKVYNILANTLCIETISSSFHTLDSNETAICVMYTFRLGLLKYKSSISTWTKRIFYQNNLVCCFQHMIYIEDQTLRIANQ